MVIVNVYVSKEVILKIFCFWGFELYINININSFIYTKYLYIKYICYNFLSYYKYFGGNIGYLEKKFKIYYRNFEKFVDNVEYNL